MVVWVACSTCIGTVKINHLSSFSNKEMERQLISNPGDNHLCLGVDVCVCYVPSVSPKSTVKPPQDFRDPFVASIEL